MLDDSDNHSIAVEPLDLDRLYANYLWTCAMFGVEPVSRERGLGLIQEWTEMLSGSPEPTKQWRERPRSTVGSSGHCNTALSLSAGVSNPKVFLGR